MSFLDGVRLALSQIWAHKLKSFFSLLGVIIGITFLIAVITMVEGMNRYVEEDLAGSIFGVNTFTVVRRPQVQTGPASDAERRRWARSPYLDLQDVEVVRDAAGGEASVAFGADRRLSEIRSGDRRRNNVRVVGGSAGFAEIQGWEVARGRGLSPLDYQRGLRGVVIGAALEDRLFPAGNPLGQPVRLGGQRYRVVGVFERQGGLLGNVLDAAVLMPFRTYNETLSRERNRVEEIHVQAESSDAMDELMSVVEGALRADRRLRPSEENDFHLQTSSDLLSAWDQINRILLTALPGLVSISLVVGGIVIMNIMLVSVAQRTQEIGLRKALGARQRDITLQFLAEAATLAGVGALLGIGAGIGLARAVEASTPLPAHVPGWSLALAVALGTGVGLLSGLYPARRAARLDPIDALRSE